MGIFMVVREWTLIIILAVNNIILMIVLCDLSGVKVVSHLIKLGLRSEHFYLFAF